MFEVCCASSRYEPQAEMTHKLQRSFRHRFFGFFFKKLFRPNHFNFITQSPQVTKRLSVNIFLIKHFWINLSERICGGRQYLLWMTKNNQSAFCSWKTSLSWFFYFLYKLLHLSLKPHFSHTLPIYFKSSYYENIFCETLMMLCLTSESSYFSTGFNIAILCEKKHFALHVIVTTWDEKKPWF